MKPPVVPGLRMSAVTGWCVEVILLCNGVITLTEPSLCPCCCFTANLMPEILFICCFCNYYNQMLNGYSSTGSMQVSQLCFMCSGNFYYIHRMIFMMVHLCQAPVLDDACA